ncbi:META domain-containing protein [Microbacterium sp. BG28]|uniref:META domain-containing protein n=1 Tax=Microbacterium sp. BG28 TaxID=3097356 RepID=UPI002A5A6048|nr:META domain-containing protein [Microbacterium sp. BG28]MDY0827799.1 META domain-containing protein [Microbacterium sp. BG28]
MTPKGEGDRRQVRNTVAAATLLTAGTLALIWFAAVPVGSGVCPASDPPPTNCWASYRAGSGVVASLLTLVLYAVAVLIALRGTSTQRRLTVAIVALLALMPAASFVAVAFSPGFTIGAASDSAPLGRWEADGDDEVHLTFLQDGTFGGYDGCNAVGGGWVLSEDTVVFRDVGQTLVACAETTDRLGAMRNAVVDGDSLQLFDRDGALTNTLTRAGR